VPFDPELLRQLLAITRKSESGDRDYRAPGVPMRSPAGALYAMQVLPSTAADPGFGVQPAAAQTPAEYNRVGEGLLTNFYKKYGDPAKAWAAYQSGPGNLNKWTQQYGDQWQKGLGPQGAKYVKQNLSALGVAPAATPLKEVAPMEEDTPIEAEAPEDNGFGVKDALEAYKTNSMSASILAAKEAELRKQQFEAARDALAKQRFGPSLSERLFALSAAIGRPRYQQEQGFGAVMGDIAPALSSLLSGKRDAEEQRAAALRQLQDTYANGTLAAQHTALDARTKMLPSLVSLAKTQQQSPGVWSESLGQFVPKNRPVPISSGVVGGLRVVKYSDGTHRVRGADGKVTVYDAAGQKIAVEGGTQ